MLQRNWPSDIVSGICFSLVTGYNSLQTHFLKCYEREMTKRSNMGTGWMEKYSIMQEIIFTRNYQLYFQNPFTEVACIYLPYQILYHNL